MAGLAGAQALAPPSKAADNDHEVFDLVDDNDDIIGQELRSVCHAKGLLHRGEWGLLAMGLALLLRRWEPCTA